MKKIGLGQTMGILANVGVVAGIAFLAIELQQNNQLLRAEAIATVLESRMFMNEEWSGNAEISAIWLKNESHEKLTELEGWRIKSLFNRQNLGWQRDFFYFQEGILPEEYLRANVPLMKRAFINSGETISRMDHWNGWKEFSSPLFRRFVEECVISDCENIPE